MCMANSELVRKLKCINWNFDFTINYGEDSLHPFNCRKYYSYPATFIPEIPYALIEILSQKGDVVLDPFGGIGTTFIQALSLERVPYSFDINPVATTVCNTLYSLFNPLLDKDNIKEQLLKLSEGYNSNENYRTRLSASHEDLSGWFEVNTFNEIAFLLLQYNQIDDPTVREVMKLVLSSILVTLSSQNKGWAYIADNVKPKEDELRKKPVFEQYRNSVKTLLNDIVSHERKLSKTFDGFYLSLLSQERVFGESITEVNIESNTVNLIVTSPPYPRMIDYVKSQRLSFSFLNEKYADYVAKEIGARYRRSRRDFLEEYESSILDVNNKMIDILKPGGYLCVVLPDYETTDNRKSVIDNVIKNYFDLGLFEVFDVSRYIPSNKRTLSIQWATLVNERIYIFQKG